MICPGCGINLPKGFPRSDIACPICLGEMDQDLLELAEQEFNDWVISLEAKEEAA